MKTISIGGISLFLTLPLIAMELFNIEDKRLEQLSSLSTKNLIPNKLDINETNNDSPTTYSALNNLHQENNFRFDISETEYATLASNGYGPTLGLAICPKKEQSSMEPGPSKPRKKILESDNDNCITSFAFDKHSEKILVGRIDGTITLFGPSKEASDMKTHTYDYYERNCSLNPICSVAFGNDGSIIATDEKKLHVLNTKTNILLSIANDGTALNCPSLNEGQIMVVQEYWLKLSPHIPSDFFNHSFSDEQYRFLIQFAQIKTLDYPLLKQLKNDLPTANFEPLVQIDLGKRLEWAMKQKKSNILATIKESASTCFKILHDCYTGLTEPVTHESTTRDNV